MEADRKTYLMDRSRKAHVTAVFEALGPERVARGLTAHGHNWNDCFLALALGGERGALVRELEQSWRREQAIAVKLTVPAEYVSEVVQAWDGEEDTFRALATEWLEANRVPAAPEFESHHVAAQHC